MQHPVETNPKGIILYEQKNQEGGIGAGSGTYDHNIFSSDGHGLHHRLLRY